MYSLLKSLLFRLPPERAHGVAMRALEAVRTLGLGNWLASRYAIRDERLSRELWSLTFPNPVGLAAGFDKNGRFPRMFQHLGFGFVEIGGVTPEPQEGNPRPRLFRLPRDRALINRMGFNSEGSRRVAERLDNQTLPDVPLGINLAKNRETPLEEAGEDYRTVYRRLRTFGDFFVVNVSSPNTPELRSLQQSDHLTSILTVLREEDCHPLLVKLSPDLEERQIDDILQLADENLMDGLVATNTTTRRAGLKSSQRDEAGGLSGEPLRDRATEMVEYLADRTSLPVIGVGGIFDHRDARQKLKAGASLVQLYTGLVYEGPGIARSINRGLVDWLVRKGRFLGEGSGRS